MQISTFLKKTKMVLSVVGIKLKCRWLQTGLPNKTRTKQLKFCLDLLRIFKNVAFFEIFEIHQLLMLKLLNALYLSVYC